MLSIAAVGVALLGWLLAHIFYRQKSTMPARLAADFPGGYKLLENKYYVDEILRRDDGETAAGSLQIFVGLGGG